MPLIDDIPQLDSVYIFNDTKILSEKLMKKWQKIKSVHTDIDDLCQGFQLGIKQYHQDSIVMSFVTVNELTSTDNLNQLEPTFMYTQIFKDILLNMEHGKQAIKNFAAYCRHNDCMSSTNIDRLEKEYHAQLAIWWYTSPLNLYSMLNQALRMLDADVIINMGFFLCDVHQQIQQLYEQQVNSYERKPFLVYRGQSLVKSDFGKLQKTKGGLISFNSFLSTSTDKEVSLGFAQIASTEPNKIGILFIMSINPCIKSTLFASIKELSHYKDENEVLFSMHTVFRVGEIKQIDSNDQLYEVELQLTSDEDQQLRILTDRIREDTSGTGWQRLGDLLCKIGQLNKAEELYNVLVEQASDEGEKAHYYHQLAFVHCNQGDYEKAISYYEQGLSITEKTLPSNHPKFAYAYNNIASVYSSMREYSKALSYYESALEIFQKTLPLNHSDLAISYNNIGNIYVKMGEYSKALSFYKKALEIGEITLLLNPFLLAALYSNIGGVYDSMGEYLKALSYYEKALEILKRTLPPHHPDLATSYNNIANITLPSNHPDLATSYNSIANMYYNMGAYSKALSYYEKALEIREKTLPSNHPNLAISYNNIANVYHKMREYSKALSSHEKALEIQKKTLPSYHSDFVQSYNNIGGVYDSMGEYLKALSSHEKALEIQKKTLPSYHPDLATSYNNIANMYYNMGAYSKSLSYSERALNILQCSLPSTHPTVEHLKTNIQFLKRNYKE
ncbi:unnamed protein product [Adineta steineri]|uniref:NAD(P)(+)--arginine ADP-ribosyltransferase n=1 Tax=Adineta steineri TaxID=433720 RepID=A0A815JYR7_9BILA|nr:unnamed protein product [Adineta steineri]CAF1609121.1 unnamed protein product [Adineta steineri]